MRIRLNTAVAGSEGFVGYFEMLPYNPPPDVVTWGLRTFKMRRLVVDEGDTWTTRPVEPPPQDNCAYIYDECFAVAIISERQNS